MRDEEQDDRMDRLPEFPAARLAAGKDASAAPAVPVRSQRHSVVNDAQMRSVYSNVVGGHGSIGVAGAENDVNRYLLRWLLGAIPFRENGES